MLRCKGGSLILGALNCSKATCSHADDAVPITLLCRTASFKRSPQPAGKHRPLISQVESADNADHCHRHTQWPMPVSGCDELAGLLLRSTALEEADEADGGVGSVDGTVAGRVLLADSSHASSEAGLTDAAA